MQWAESLTDGLINQADKLTSHFINLSIHSFQYFFLFFLLLVTFLDVIIFVNMIFFYSSTFAFKAPLQ